MKGVSWESCLFHLKRFWTHQGDPSFCIISHNIVCPFTFLFFFFYLQSLFWIPLSQFFVQSSLLSSLIRLYSYSLGQNSKHILKPLALTSYLKTEKVGVDWADGLKPCYWIINIYPHCLIRSFCKYLAFHSCNIIICTSQDSLRRIYNKDRPKSVEKLDRKLAPVWKKKSAFFFFPGYRKIASLPTYTSLCSCLPQEFCNFQSYADR